jgi:hypothetical protein
MPEIIWCVSLEWGWGFLAPVLIVMAVLIVVIAVLMIKGGSGRLSVGYEKIKLIATGGPVNIVITLLVAGAVSLVLYQAYKTLKDSYSVALNTPGRELEQVRNDFQSETHLVITVKDPAKKFSIAGSYHGACVADLFEAICRQYAPNIVCDASISKRTLIVDLKRP